MRGGLFPNIPIRPTQQDDPLQKLLLTLVATNAQLAADNHRLKNNDDDSSKNRRRRSRSRSRSPSPIKKRSTSRERKIDFEAKCIYFVCPSDQTTDSLIKLFEEYGVVNRVFLTDHNRAMESCGYCEFNSYKSVRDVVEDGKHLKTRKGIYVGRLDAHRSSASIQRDFQRRFETTKK